MFHPSCQRLGISPLDSPSHALGTSEYLSKLEAFHESVNTSPEVWKFTSQQEVKKELFVAMA